MAIKKIKLPGMAQPVDIGTTWANVSGKPDLMTSNEISAAINAAFATNDAMVFKGTIGAGGTVTQLPATHEAGWTYKVISNGSLAGQTCEIGDMIVCVKDGTVATADDWTVIQTNVDGVVAGPASSIAGHIATFTGTTGKAIQDSGYAITDITPSISTTGTGNAVTSVTSTNGEIIVNKGNTFATPDIITISSTQPTSSDNKIWISSTSANGVQVPTVAEALSLGITGATTGQMIAVSAVNGTGAPTNWATITLSNLSAVENGTTVSLVTTGEKYNWNNKAELASPGFTGVPTAPTATTGTNSTQIATTAFVKAAIDAAFADIAYAAGHSF